MALFNNGFTRFLKIWQLALIRGGESSLQHTLLGFPSILTSGPCLTLLPPHWVPCPLYNTQHSSTQGFSTCYSPA